MNINRFLLPLSAALSIVPQRARAWGAVGHKAIGMIAQDRLTPEALSQVHAILGQALTLDEIANCADQQRAAKAPFLCGGPLGFEVDPDGGKSFSWHFLDIPQDEAPTYQNLAKNCPNGSDCVVAQIDKDIAVLKDPGASKHAKQMALMYLVHFVGDEHQPLHCPSFDPKNNDLGGNKLKVDFVGENSNLHAVWDDILEDGVSWNTPDAQLTAMAAQLAGQLEQRIAEDRTVPFWTVGDMNRDAALESFSISKNLIRPVYDADRGVMGEAYRQEMQGVAYKRLEMAGVRLAAILNQTLAAPSQAAYAAADARIPDGAARGALVVQRIGQFEVTYAAPDVP